MGLNVYMTYAASKGYKTAASATAITHDIDGRSGERIAILAYGATASETTDKVYFMQPLATTTIKGAMSSNVVTVTLAALPSLGSNAIASGDLLAIQMDNGSFLFSLLDASSTTSVWSIAENLTDTAASGNAVYWMGLATDTGHVAVQLTGSTQSTAESALGIIYGDAKGYPMRVHNASAGTVPGSIDYITIGYINK